jgi:hypothetical protein
MQSFVSVLTSTTAFSHNLIILLPLGTFYCRKNGCESTIDLVSSLSHWSTTLIACCLKEVIDHGSDHFPIEGAFSFPPPIAPYALRNSEERQTKWCFL